jgi:hypothetical protein
LCCVEAAICLHANCSSRTVKPFAFSVYQMALNKPRAKRLLRFFYLPKKNLWSPTKLLTLYFQKSSIFKGELSKEPHRTLEMVLIIFVLGKKVQKIGDKTQSN